jgi:hypothetical protein
LGNPFHNLGNDKSSGQLNYVSTVSLKLRIPEVVNTAWKIIFVEESESELSLSIPLCI